MEIKDVIELGGGEALALVGGGGKTTALFQLARQLAGPPILTATTHLGADQLALADRHVEVTSAQDVDRAAPPGTGEGILYTGPLGGKDRTEGLQGQAMERVRALAIQLNRPLLMEADGSRGRPLKAPADFEPAIPEWVDGVVVVAGLSGIGQPLNSEKVHRPERYAGLAQINLEEQVTFPAAVRVLMHADGGLKRIPQHARRIALLNQADTPALQSAAYPYAEMLTEAYDRVIIASLGRKTKRTATFLAAEDEGPVYASFTRTAAILLAAGAGRRFGQAKQILPWSGEPMVRHIAKTALAAGLSPVVVVCGAYNEEVRQALAGLPVSLADNAQWAEGQSTSIRQGIAALPGRVGAAVFLLVDQPQVSEVLLRALVEKQRRSAAAVIAPLVADRRANPVLFDRRTFPDLSALTGDVGGRAVFSKYTPLYLPWQDERLLLDIDTPEDYRRLLESGR